MNLKNKSRQIYSNMRDQTIELLKWMLTAVLGTGWVSTFMFYRTKKRKENVEADKEELQFDIAQIEHLKKQNKDAYETIEKLQCIINGLREDNLGDKKIIHDLELRLLDAVNKQKVAEYNSCFVDDCCDRIPKRDTDLCKHKAHIGNQ